MNRRLLVKQLDLHLNEESCPGCPSSRFQFIIPFDEKPDLWYATSRFEIPLLLRQTLQKSFVPPLTDKGKGKGTKFASSSMTNGSIPEEDMAPDCALEYNENFIEESDDSGSEFEISEGTDDEMHNESEPSAPRTRKSRKALPTSESDNDAEIEEEAMLDVAIRMSLRTAGLDSIASGAGPSSRPMGSPNRAAAAAAERRLARVKGTVYNGQDSDGLSFRSEPEATSSDEEPLNSTLKAKAKGKKLATIRNTSMPKSMTMAELGMKKKQDRRHALAEKRANKAEEAALRKALGRRLTHVR
jgi:hypothetical protein